MSSGSAVSLEQLVALNDEMSALVRAGIPLESGLRILSEEQLGRIATISASLSREMDRGQSLDEALRREGHAIPPLYLAVVRAGVRSGRLSSALEGLSAYARDYAETRRVLGLALLYPLLILVASYGFFFTFVSLFATRFVETFEMFRLGETWPIRVLAFLVRTFPFWASLVPLILLVILVWWVASSRSSSLSPGRFGSLPRWLPGFRGMLRDAQSANFASLLALLVDHGVPLGEALGTAAEASGDSALRSQAQSLVNSIHEGRPVAEAVRAPSAIPPVLFWILTTGQRQGELAPSLRHAATTYRRRSLRQAERIRQWMPAVLLVTIGGVVVFSYMLAILLPLSSLWESLANPPR